MALKGEDYLIRKWDRVFHTFFDLNNSGAIDYGDFEVLFDEIAKLRGRDSTEFKIAEQAMTTVWKGLLNASKGMDMAREPPPDIEISLEEWRKIWHDYDPKHMRIWEWEYLKYMFFLLDSSGDKFIDEKEYVDVMKIYKLETENATTAFHRIAVDGNGKRVEKVDYGQFMKLWNEYFTSKEQWHPGNYLFGTW